MARIDLVDLGHAYHPSPAAPGDFAVRTIYVKFGGKAGLLNAVIENGRAHFFAGMSDMASDTRPMREVLEDFAVRFLELVSMPSFVSLHRMVVAEAKTTPELAETFYQAGPLRTREQLTRFFNRPEVRAQMRADVPLEMLAVHLTSWLTTCAIWRCRSW